MLNKLLREIVGIVVGKNVESIADLLNSPKYVNEFNIAKKLDITINQTRNILYRVSEFGLVSSIRKKDKKKGWYTYFWKFEILKCLEFFRDHLVKLRDELGTQINSREKNKFYICERCSIESNEEEALLNSYTCNECGEIFTIKDNEKIIKDLKRNYSKIVEELKIVESEIQKEKAILEKVKQKEIKKQEKETLKKKEDAAQKRKLAREENAKKKAAEKNPVLKKVPKAKVEKKKSVPKKTKPSTKK